MFSHLNDEGQISLDFVLGLGLFMIALIYLVTAIPGVFLPYQSNAVDLNSVAYRTSSLLVEDPGWYMHPGGLNGTEWESPNNIAYVSRIGLASSKQTPDVISLDKINALNESVLNPMPFVNYSVSLNKLGLNSTIKYNYNLSIQWADSTGNNYQLQKGPSPSSATVDGIQRNVLIDEGKRLLISDGSVNDPTGSNSNMNVWLNGNQNYTDNSVIMTIMNTPAGSFNYLSVYGMGGHPIYLNLLSDYNVTENGVIQTKLPVITNPGDRLDIIVNWNSTKAYYKHDNKPMDLWFVNTGYACFGNDNMNMSYDSSNPVYWSLYDKGTLQLKVWT